MDNTHAAQHERGVTTGHIRGRNSSTKGPHEDEETRLSRSVAELRSIPGVGMFMTPGNSSSSSDAIPGSGMRQSYYPTSEISDPNHLEAFHTRVRLTGNREGLLVDLGAHDNLTGSEWVDRVGAWLHKHHPGERVQTSKLGRSISIEGVGTNPDRCENAVRVPLHMADGEAATFDAPVIPNSSVPALLGMRSLAAKRAVVDVSAKPTTHHALGRACAAALLAPVVHGLSAAPNLRNYWCRLRQRCTYSPETTVPSIRPRDAVCYCESGRPQLPMAGRSVEACEDAGSMSLPSCVPTSKLAPVALVAATRLARSICAAGCHTLEGGAWCE